jgi:tRNA(Arg) A34 adenosine deaminase TadA
MIHPNKKIMEKAIALASKDYKKGGGYAVAAIIVKDDKIIAKAITTINKKQDPTCHAEINVIKAACKKLKSKRLERCYIYSTYEPCPMCASATVWARMEGIVYGASMEDETEINPQRIKIHCAEIIDKGTPRLKIYPNFMRDECKKLLSL